MTNQTLLIDADQGGLAVVEQPLSEAGHGEPLALADLRTHALSVPVETMQRGLAEYSDRRKAFRDWLKSQLVTGSHYGFPPGCEPKSEMRDGVMWYRSGQSWFPETQWEPKPSLYQAGADFVIDLMGVRPEFAADIDAWKQLGEPKDTFVFCCKLFSKATKELLGEGRGARKVGQKGGDANNAIKMAMKGAKVSAVLNTWGLADLWTQDLEDGPPQPQHDNPEASPDVPTEKPRGNRPPPASKAPTEVSPDQLGHVSAHWKATHPQADGDTTAQRQKFYTWARTVAKREFDPSKLASWKTADYHACCDMLKIPSLEDLK